MFCLLEKDQKTYDYFIYYTMAIESHVIDLSEADAILHDKEIRTHLYLNQITPKDETEKILWIREYGKKFRHYLNTLKILAIMWHISKDSSEVMTIDIFYTMVDKLNAMNSYLELIHG
jgi:hypothetical protein